MPQKHAPKNEAGNKAPSREQQLTRTTKSSPTSKTTTKSEASREQASKAADAGAAPEQLDSELE